MTSVVIPNSVIRLKKKVYEPEDLMSGIFQLEIIPHFGLNARMGGINKSNTIIATDDFLYKTDREYTQLIILLHIF